MSDLYLMQDGTYADPTDCVTGKDGVLRHKENGLAVAAGPNGEPMTLSKSAEHNAKAAKAGESDAPPPAGEPLATTQTVAPKPAKAEKSEAAEKPAKAVISG